MKKKLHTTFWALGILVLLLSQLLTIVPTPRAYAAAPTLDDYKAATGKYSAYASFHSCLLAATTIEAYSGIPSEQAMSFAVQGIAATVGWVADKPDGDGKQNCPGTAGLWYAAAGYQSTDEMYTDLGLTKTTYTVSGGVASGTYQPGAGTTANKWVMGSLTPNDVASKLTAAATKRKVPTTLPSTGGLYFLSLTGLEASGGCGATLTKAAAAGANTVPVVENTGNVIYKTVSLPSSGSTSYSGSYSGGSAGLKAVAAIPDPINSSKGPTTTCDALIKNLNGSSGAAKLGATLVAGRVAQTSVDLAKIACEKAGVTGAKLKTCLSDFAKWTKACINDYYAKNPSAISAGTYDADAIATCIIDKNGGEGVKGTYNITKADLAGLVKAAMDSNTPSPAAGADNTKDPCSVLPEGTQMKWLTCSILLSLDGILTALYSTIQAMLVTPNEIFEKDGFIAATSVFRNFGLALLVIAGLIMIIAQASGSDLVDAYTVKKVLPRIGVALVGIALAIPLLRLAVIFTNDIGILIGNLMGSIGGVVAGPAPASGASEGFGAVVAWIIGGGATGVGLMHLLRGSGVLSLIGTIALALLVGFIVLTIRQLVIVVLVLLAPLAIASSILPGTEKLWKYWRSTLLTTLAMFPIIMLFLSSGKFMASIFGTMNNGLFAILAYFAPYFMLPFAFKLAGGLMSNIFQAVQGKAAGGFKMLSGMRANQLKRRGEELKHGNFFSDKGRVGRALNTTTRGLAKMDDARLGMNPREWGSRMRTVMQSGEHDAATEFMKSEAFSAIKEDDAKLGAARMTDRTNIENELARLDSGRFGGPTNARARYDAATQILQAQRATNAETFKRARVRAQAATGTGFQDPITGEVSMGQVVDEINEAYGSDRNGAVRALNEIRGALTNSGQVGGIAGFSTWSKVLNQRYEASQGLRTYSREQANDDIYDDVVVSAQPGQAVYGKPSSAAQIGAAHYRRIQSIANSLMTNTEMDMKDPVSGVVTRRVATQDDLDAATASAAGLLDAMGGATGLNGSAFDNNLMGLTVVGSGQTTTRYIPATEDILGPDGSVIVPGTPAHIVEETGPDLTVREMIDDRMNNPEYRNRRRDFHSQALSQAEAAQRLATAIQIGAGGGTPGGAPTGPPGP